MTLAKLLHPKVQESFDPFYHTLPPTFASGVPQEVWGESKRGCGEQVGRWAGGQGTRALTQKRKIRGCSQPNNANMKREKGE